MLPVQLEPEQDQLDQSISCYELVGDIPVHTEYCAKVLVQSNQRVVG